MNKATVYNPDERGGRCLLAYSDFYPLKPLGGRSNIEEVKRNTDFVKSFSLITRLIWIDFCNFVPQK